MDEVVDVVIIGGGPAGLMAANESGRLGLRTILLERLKEPGQLSHPCGSMFAPMKGLATLSVENGGVRFQELDWLLPQQFITGYGVLGDSASRFIP
jgi:flavin-dependent dehydrogenase